MGLLKEPCLLVPSRQSSVASRQFDLDFQGAKSFERNLKLFNFSSVRAYAQSHRRPSLRVQIRWRRSIIAALLHVPSMLRPGGTASVHARISAPERLNRVHQSAAFPSESRPTPR